MKYDQASEYREEYKTSQFGVVREKKTQFNDL